MTKTSQHDFFFFFFFFPTWLLLIEALKSIQKQYCIFRGRIFNFGDSGIWGRLLWVVKFPELLKSCVQFSIYSLLMRKTILEIVYWRAFPPVIDFCRIKVKMDQRIIKFRKKNRLQFKIFKIFSVNNSIVDFISREK